jgi:hypothetical protein
LEEQEEKEMKKGGRQEEGIKRWTDKIENFKFT